MRVLVHGLPPDSALHRSSPEHGGWTTTDHLLATAIDAIGIAGYKALVGSHVDSKRLRREKPPAEIPRPGAHHARRRKASSDDLKRMFGGAVAYRPKEVS